MTDDQAAPSTSTARTGTSNAVTAAQAQGRRDAVSESMLLFDKLWHEWRTQHGLGDVETVMFRPPVVYQVGIDHNSLVWVALIRFTAVADGERLQGLVRGPASDPTFRVAQRLDDPLHDDDLRARRSWAIRIPRRPSRPAGRGVRRQ